MGAGSSLRVRTDIRVEGMTCGACVARVESVLGAAGGVIDARVNFASGRATVLHDGSIDTIFTFMSALLPECCQCVSF